MTDRNSWEEIECTGDIPAPRERHIFCVLNDKIYMFGGRTSDLEYTNDFYEFNPKNYVWKCLSGHKDTSNSDEVSSPPSKEDKYPPPRYEHACVSLPQNEQIIISSGKCKRGGLCDVWCFDFKTQQWSQPRITDQFCCMVYIFIYVYFIFLCLCVLFLFVTLKSTSVHTMYSRANTQIKNENGQINCEKVQIRSTLGSNFGTIFAFFGIFWRMEWQKLFSGRCCY